MERVFLEQAALHLGLPCEPGRGRRCRIAGWPIDFGLYCPEGEDQPFVRIEVDARGRIPKRLYLGAERVQTEGRNRDILTHDASFDNLVHLEGPELEAIAILDGRTRVLVAQQARILDHVVRDSRIYLAAGELGDDAPIDLVQEIVALAGALDLRDGEVPERLARNATTDPNPSVRLRNLSLLLKHYGSSVQAGDACRAALSSGSPDLRLLAGEHLGPGGLATMEALALDEDVADRIRIGALQHLAERMDQDRAIPILERALASRSRALREKVLEEFVRLDHRPALDRLVAAGDGAEPRTLAIVAELAGESGDPAAEPALLRWLGSDSVDVKAAVARALGKVGSVAAVEPLLPLTRGLLADAGLKRAAREAIEEIQKRLGNADEGRLSLSERSPEKGALSLSSEEGKLSLTEHGDAGRKRTQAASGGETREPEAGGS